jgi:hypothetical protein
MRFYMSMRYRHRFYRDEEGDELQDLEAAQEHALATARDMIRHTRTQIIRDWFDCTFEISDDSGRIVLTVPLGDTVVDRENGGFDADVN